MSGFTIVYSALAGAATTASVPTLGTVATIGLSALTAAAGAFALKGRATTQRMVAAGLCAGLMAALSVSGIGASAWADARDYFSSASGGSFTYDDDINSADTWFYPGQVYSSGRRCGKASRGLNNGTGVAIKIEEITSNDPFLSVHTDDADYTLAKTNSTAPRCVANSTVLQPGDSCQVILSTNRC